MDERDCGRSRDLERVRELLFPGLSEDEGWQRIDAAITGAGDEERWDAIEREAAEEQLDASLLEQLKNALRMPDPGLNGV
jgi:hypothetical protein